MIYRKDRTTPPSPIYKTEASVRPIYREEARSSPAESPQPVVAAISSAFALVQPSLSPIYIG